MKSIIKKSKARQSIKAGLPPGTLIYVGKERDTKPVMSLFAYKGAELFFFDDTDIATLNQYLQQGYKIWLNIDGVHDINTIKQVGQYFGLHRLTMEDIVNTIQRPKWEEFENYGFTSLKMLYYEDSQIFIEQVSMILTTNCVITFQEQPEDVFDSLRDRLRNPNLALCKRESDYLFYALIDVITSYYFSALEKIEDSLEMLGQDIYEEIPLDYIKAFQQASNDLINLRKIVFPLRPCINQWTAEGNKLITQDTRPFFFDLKDQIFSLVDSLENYRESLNNLQNIYFTLINHKMNQVVKTLTVMATLFIPLTFVVGIYGMNFEHMPELDWQWGYLTVWLGMAIIVIGMLIFFRRRKWI